MGMNNIVSDVHKLEAAKSAMQELDISTGAPLRIGLGTGSTAKHFVDLLGARVAEGFECICVPTSEQTAEQAGSLRIPLSDLDHLDQLDITIDGTDEITADLSLIKGGGGALLREKIVAAASKKMIVIADDSKSVETLGAFPLPIEVNKFGLMATKNAIAKVAGALKLSGDLLLRKKADETPFITDEGHLILDACFGRISNPKELSNELLQVPGVVQHGLFLNLCQNAYIAGANGVIKLSR